MIAVSRLIPISLDPPSRHPGKFAICSTAEFSGKPLGLGSAYRGPLCIPLENRIVDHTPVCGPSILTKREDPVIKANIRKGKYIVQVKKSKRKENGDPGLCYQSGAAGLTILPAPQIKGGTLSLHKLYGVTPCDSLWVMMCSAPQIERHRKSKKRIGQSSHRFQSPCAPIKKRKKEVKLAPTGRH